MLSVRSPLQVLVWLLAVVTPTSAPWATAPMVPALTARAPLLPKPRPLSVAFLPAKVMPPWICRVPPSPPELTVRAPVAPLTVTRPRAPAICTLTMPPVVATVPLPELARPEVGLV